MTATLFIFSLTSAFLSGLLALFAPCCITFLLPSYFTSIFQGRKHIVFMTVIFFFGLATILLPIILGVAWLSSFFTDYHEVIFTIGGSLLILYGILSFFGKTVMIPLHYMPNLQQSRGVFGIYLLGIFSGIASSCCAPVLAGMLTLTALSASLPLAMLIGLTYILGMTLPLFILSLIWDNKKIGQSKLFRGLPINLKIGKWNHKIHSTHLLVSIIFILIGWFVLYTAVNGEAASAAPWQTAISAEMQGQISQISALASNHPFLSMFIYLVLITIWVWLVRRATSDKGNE